MLAENPDLSGIYMTTASSAIACQVIRQSCSQDLKIITTDLLRDTPDLLRSGIACATLFQNPFQQGEAVVKLLYDRLVLDKAPDNRLLTPTFIFKSNLPDYLNGVGQTERNL